MEIHKTAADYEIERLVAKIIELEEKRNTWQELAAMRGEKIAELEEQVHRYEVTSVKAFEREQKGKADAIREMVKEVGGWQDYNYEAYLNTSDVLEYADNLEGKSDE